MDAISWVSSSRFTQISMSISCCMFFGFQMSTFKVYQINPAVHIGSNYENISSLITTQYNDYLTK